MENENLKIGDLVMWRGCFGMDDPLPALVTGLTVTDYPREKYGHSVEEVSWTTVWDNCCVVFFDNGHWAYGEQISLAEVN